MDEYSRIFIEEYCMKYPKTQKAALLSKLVRMSYDVCSIPTDMQMMQLSQLISREKNADLQEELEDLYEFMIGY